MLPNSLQTQDRILGFLAKSVPLANPKTSRINYILGPRKKEECFLAQEKFPEPRSSRGKSIPIWASERNTEHPHKMARGNMNREKRKDIRSKRK